MTTLKPHQQRVVAEEAELAARIDKLDSALAPSSTIRIDPDERALLVAQLSAMRTYRALLNLRIDRWTAHPVLTLADSLADLNGTPRPDHPN